MSDGNVPPPPSYEAAKGDSGEAGAPQPPPYDPQQPNPAGYPQQPTLAGYPQQPTPAGYPQQPAGYPQQPAGYPQQPAGYPQQPPYIPPQGAPPGVAPATVVMNQPTMVVHQTIQFRDRPVLCGCPNCHNQVTSQVEREIGGLTWLLVGGLFIVGLWMGCCLIPLCVDGCKDAVHTCPVCNYRLGRWSQL